MKETEAVLKDTERQLEATLAQHQARLNPVETGCVTYVGQGVALVEGLPSVGSQELVRFANGDEGVAMSLDPGQVGVVLLSRGDEVRAGTEVTRTGRVVDVPVGAPLLGRVIDATGRVLDRGPPLPELERWPIERDAPAILDRAPVTEPLATGFKVIDALIPVGHGQRELILGDRQTGKTTVALDTVINQKDQEVICIWCAIGQRTAAVAHVVETLRQHHALAYTVVMVAAGEDPPGLQYITPYAATSLAEYFMQDGRRVLIVYDDLTRHARAYRELCLLLRRPPGREAYPGDIFYIHSRLLERSTHLRQELGGGSLTALPIVETEAQNLAAYIPTNLISITDGQIYLSPELFHRGILPAIDVGKSVSRVGGKAQLPAYRAVAGDLRLSYAQFEELEAFARFGTRLDDATRQALERGRRVRETLKQAEHVPLTVAEQIVILLALNAGLFDAMPVEQLADAQQRLCDAFRTQLPELLHRLARGEKLEEKDREYILETTRGLLTPE
ncbi:MAG: alternate F1F0 ATPase, F1 subunit alpha [Pseudomonadota bacterium]|nr:alternate F1F0 ATPase, F1 subunit alpha [Pseudomonadota bacterium]